MSTKIMLYWAKCGPRYGNFGDKLSPLVVSTLTGREVAYSPLSEASIVACGSLTQEIPEDYTGFVWGTGCMYRDHFTIAPRARVFALRGKLTAMRFSHVGRDVPLGDVGLLCSVLWPYTGQKLYPLGIVPHYVDYDNAGLGEFLRQNPDVLVIDPCGRTREVIEQICSCEHIISSSLHGLVVADSYRIPNDWVLFSHKVAGGDFKFCDHKSIFGQAQVESIPFSAYDTTQSLIDKIKWHGVPRLNEIQRDLLNAFPYPTVGQWQVK